MKALLVDSDPLFSRIVTSRLGRLGYTVSSVPDGEAAWELYQLTSFRIVITEYDLPRLDGPELCRRITNSGRDQPSFVMFYATRSDNDSVIAAYQAGADDFLTKPFNPLLLELRLRRRKQIVGLGPDSRERLSRDHLTGFIKYGAFKRFFSVQQAGARKFNHRGVVTFAAIENLDHILAARGFGGANQIKSVVASVLGSTIRSSDLAAHTGEGSGGFCILMPDTPRENIGTVIERIESQLRNNAVLAGKDVLRPHLEYSTVTYPEANLNVDQCLSPENRKPYHRQIGSNYL